LALLNAGVQISGIWVKLTGHQEGTEKNLCSLFFSKNDDHINKVYIISVKSD